MEALGQSINCLFLFNSLLVAPAFDLSVAPCVVRSFRAHWRHLNCSGSDLSHTSYCQPDSPFNHGEHGEHIFCSHHLPRPIRAPPKKTRTIQKSRTALFSALPGVAVGTEVSRGAQWDGAGLCGHPVRLETEAFWGEAGW